MGNAPSPTTPSRRRVHPGITATAPSFAPRSLVTALTLVASLGLPLPLAAQLPIGPSVMNGTATIGTLGSLMTVTNSPGAVINWQGFSIGAGYGVHFAQQSAASQVLNRVTGRDPSHILGNLTSNGGVWLINPHGVLFGRNARVDVGGLVASTLDIADADFAASRFRFDAASPTGAAVVNEGELRTTFGGRVWLLGEQIRNEGLVEAPGGKVVLAAGKRVKIVDSGTPNVVVEVSGTDNAVVNRGTLVTNGGRVDVHASIVNQDGIVHADGIGTDANGEIVLRASGDMSLGAASETRATGGRVQLAARTLNNRGKVKAKAVQATATDLLQQGRIEAPGGRIDLSATGTTYLDGAVDVSDPTGAGGRIALQTGKLEGMAHGSLLADGETGGSIHVTAEGMAAFSSTLAATGTARGGTIEVTGDSVYLLNANVDASGGTQGGTVHLGGGWQGSGDLPHAREVLVGVGSEVRANGSSGGLGGEIVVWSTEASEHYGSLQALDGGRIELSSRGTLRQGGDIQAGPGGRVLFDPKNLIVTNSPPDDIALALVVTSGSLDGGSPALADGDSFGTSVALDGDRLAVGAPYEGCGESTACGAVHLFTGVGTDYSGLTWQGKLASGTGADSMPRLSAYDGFGYSVALDGDRLAVGAPGLGTEGVGPAGRVHLFSGVGADFSGLVWQKALASGTGAASMPTLADFDFFGASVSLDGDRLAVGATHDDTGGANRGAVHLFAGVGTDFSGLEWRQRLASDAGATAMPALVDLDYFGTSVALDGDRLAVGASGDDASGNARGAVHLFSGIGTDFSGLEWRQRLASDTGAIGMPVLTDGAAFGSAVALDGDRLVVGAIGDAGGGINRGAVHLFARVGADFSGLTWLKKLASGRGATGMPTLTDADFFGSSVALDGDRLAVGAPGDDTGGGGRGAVYLFRGLSTLGANLIGVADATFAASAADTSYITPATIVALLDSGTDVTLQANNDIEVRSSIWAPTDSGAALTLQAGRNISILQTVGIPFGALTAVAGDPAADPAHRDAGTPTITIAHICPEGCVDTIATGGVTTLAAIGGRVVNRAGEDAIAGRWLIYAADPATTTEGFASYNKHYDQTYTPGVTPAYARRGNWFLYSIAPTITVASDGQTITYGDALPTFSPSYSGFIDGDTVATAGITGTPTWSVDGTTSSSGNLTAGAHDVRFTEGLASRLGYRFADDAASTDELTVTARDLAAAYAAADKVYDGTTAATVTASSTDLVAGDLVTFTETAAFADKNAGTDKEVSIIGITLGGTDATNYVLQQDTATAVADITPRDLTATYAAADKVYDGTTAATVTASSTDLVAGDLVSFSQSASFADENVGADKTVSITAITLGGIDAGNYTLLAATATTTADITPRTLTASLVGTVRKVYDATTMATLARRNLSLSGVVAGDAVGLTVTGRPLYADANVGTGKTVTAPGLALTGADEGNYSLATDTIIGNVGTITPATLTYLADTFTAPVGVPLIDLEGTVAGFLGTDTLASATTGALVWETPATTNSDAGSYPILGDGLSATNYVLVQAPANATALTLVALDTPESPLVAAVGSAIHGTTTAIDLGDPDIDPHVGRVMDRTLSLICAETPSFETLDLTKLSREEAEQLLESRKECKKRLFADAIEQLEKDPTLADVSLCTNLADADSGGCRLTDAQRDQVAAAADGRGAYRVRVAKLPQIERKVAVLFGIDDYADGRIPTLDNPISDAEAVGRVLSQKLGYEVRVVRNATKADIVRTLNQLSTEVKPGDSVVVYYAGHGDVVEKTGIGYWLPADAAADDAKRWLSNDDVSRMLAGIKSRQLAMISDSCYSGTFAKEQKVVLDSGRVRPENVLTRRSVVVMSSGGDEPVADSGRGGHSIFAWYLMRDLGKVNNWQPGTDLFPDIQREVSRAFPQTPQYGAAASAGHEQGGDYLFEFRQLEKGG